MPQPLFCEIQKHPPPSIPHFPLVHLYAAHLLARWGARMWEFSVGLYMINVWPHSLLLAAVYGLMETASTALFSPLIGQWIQKFSYIQVLRVWLLSQSLSFTVAGCAVITILFCSGLISSNFAVFLILVALINISGAVGALSTLAGTILVEREWLVVISDGHPPEVLTQMNSTIRRIDLICNLFAPVATGFIISFASLTTSAITLALWNIPSLFLQYWLFLSVYSKIPALSQVSRMRQSRSLIKELDKTTLTDHDKNHLLSSAADDLGPVENGTKGKIFDWFSNLSYINAWRAYIKQENVLLPALALALLYFNVLSFGTLMTATLEWEGVATYVIGIARGVSGAVGIGATFLYPKLQSRVSTPRTGLWSIWSQWTCLLFCVASIFIKDKLVSAYVLMGGVAASRIGLWMFDLSVLQQMQDHVSESDRCVVGGVQNSLQSVLDSMTYVTCIMMSDPQEFWKLVVLSFALVTISAVLYGIHMYRLK